jgi:hypothetical protein
VKKCDQELREEVGLMEDMLKPFHAREGKS